MKNVIDITNEKYINVSISANNEEIKIDKYSVKDCVLVRTTTGFPTNCIVETPYNNKTVIMNGISTILGIEINKKIREMYEPLSNEFKEIEKLTELKYRNLRPTTHFCINGLVTNVEANDFTNREYVVFSELEPQLENESLESLRVEDTYFSNNVLISKILMSKEQYEKIKDNSKYSSTLENLQVFIYDSTLLTQQEAVIKVLHILGKDAFIINSYGLSDQKFNYIKGEIESDAFNLPNKASQMAKLIYDICIGKEMPDKTFSFEPHMGSDIQSVENKLVYEEGIKEDLSHTFYLIENSSMSNEEKKELKEEIYLSINSTSGTKLNKIIKKLISKLSIEEIISLTQNFNQQFIQSIENYQEMTLYYDVDRVDIIDLINTLDNYDDVIFDDNYFDEEYDDFLDEYADKANML